MYEVSLNSFIKYAGSLDIPFSDVDVVWLKKYEAWMLKQGLAINTIGTRIRHLIRLRNGVGIKQKAPVIDFNHRGFQRVRNETRTHTI